MNFVTLLIQATALMAALIIMRPLLKRFVSPRARCALWAIPAARLLFPFELKSSLSIMAPAENVSAAVGETVSRPTGIVSPSWLGSGIGLGESDTFYSAAPSPSSPDSAVSSCISIGDILIVLWLIGAAVTAGLIIYQNIKFRRTARRHGEYMGNGFGLPLYLLSALPSPCLAGLLRPRIYINRQTLVSDEVFEMTLHHEMTHYKRLDHIWGALRGLLLALYWFHPLVWYCSELFRADCETACDAAATRGMDEAKKQSYGMALISLASRVPRGSTGRLVCLSTMNGGKKLLRERISFLAKGRTLRCAAVIAMAVATVLCFTMCTVPENESETQVQPPSPTPGSIESAPLVSESEGPAEPIPPADYADPLSELSYYLELSAVGSEFEDMEQVQLNGIIAEYGDLLRDFKLTARVSSDGRFSYIVGRYIGSDENPLHEYYSVGYGTPQGDFQVLYTEEMREYVERTTSEGALPDKAIVIHDSHIYYHPESNLILIEPISVEKTLTVIYSLYLQGKTAYMEDALSRGIALTRPDGPYIEVYLISEKWGEISERIPLTETEAESIMNEELTEIIPGFGFSAALYYNGSHEIYNENRGIPQTVLDLAVEKCDYRFGDPGMITAPITEAKLECSWLNTPVYADEADLQRLQEILRNAQFGYVGSCGYGAKLTIRMGNEMVTMYKGCDGCDSIVFGSYSGYFLGDAENEEFWEIFGMGVDVEDRLPEAPTIILNTINGTIALIEEDAQLIYDAINTGKRSELSPACACDYGITVLNGDRVSEYIYHSECGTIINIDDNSSIATDEETMEAINAALGKYKTR